MLLAISFTSLIYLFLFLPAIDKFCKTNCEMRFWLCQNGLPQIALMDTNEMQILYDGVFIKIATSVKSYFPPFAGQAVQIRVFVAKKMP